MRALRCKQGIQDNICDFAALGSPLALSSPRSSTQALDGYEPAHALPNIATRAKAGFTSFKDVQNGMLYVITLRRVRLLIWHISKVHLKSATQFQDQMRIVLSLSSAEDVSLINRALPHVAPGKIEILEHGSRTIDPTSTQAPERIQGSVRAAEIRQGIYWHSTPSILNRI